MQRKHLSEPWFTLIGLGIKSVEGRLDKSYFATVHPEDVVMWYNDSMGQLREFLTVITRVIKYKTFKAYLSKESLRRCRHMVSTQCHRAFVTGLQRVLLSSR